VTQEDLAAQATSEIPAWAFIVLIVVMVLWGSFLAIRARSQRRK
jgi:hypothetical protein